MDPKGNKMTNKFEKCMPKTMFDASKSRKSENTNLADQVVANLARRRRRASQRVLDFRRLQAGAL